MQNPHLVSEFQWSLFNQLIIRNPLYPWKSAAFQLLIGHSLLVRCGSRGKTLHLWTVLSSSAQLASMGWFKGKSTVRHGTSGPEFYGCPSSNSWKCGTWKSWKLSNLWIAESVTKSAQKRWLVHVDGLRGPSWATNRPTNYIWAIPKMMHWKVFILYTWSVGPEFLMRATHFRERLGG